MHFLWPPHLNDFIVVFLVWLLVTRINYLARFKYEAIQTLFQTVFEEYQVVFVHHCPEEGSENMRFTVNIANPHPAICP